MTEPSPTRGGSAGTPSPFRFVGIGFELVTPIVLFMFAGYWLDRWLDSAPWLLILGVVLGIVIGFWGFLRRVLPTSGDGDEGIR